MVASMWPNAFHPAHSTRSRWMSMFASLSGLLAADHGEEAAFAAAAQQHPELDDEPVNGGTSRTRCEELLVGCEALGGDASRDARHELDAGLVKPSQHLVERVLRLVWVLVLVHEPCLPAGAVERHTAQPGGEERQAIARQAEDEAAGGGGGAGGRGFEAGGGGNPRAGETSDGTGDRAPGNPRAEEAR